MSKKGSNHSNCCQLLLVVVVVATGGMEELVTVGGKKVSFSKGFLRLEFEEGETKVEIGVPVVEVVVELIELSCPNF